MRSKLCILLLVSTIVLTGCASENSATSAQDEVTYNSISGRVGSNGPILAVKIDDTY
ncbi:hypothetical protein GM50_16425, partial [freshwater metagenome]